MPSKVNLPHAIDFRALCGTVTSKLTRESRVNETFELHCVEGRGSSRERDSSKVVAEGGGSSKVVAQSLGIKLQESGVGEQGGGCRVQGSRIMVHGSGGVRVPSLSSLLLSNLELSHTQVYEL